MSKPANSLLHLNNQIEIERFLSDSTNRMSPDYGLLAGDACIVCIGDWHVSHSIKKEFLSIVTALKARGLSHVALELLPTDVQPLLTAYFAARHNMAESPLKVDELREQVKSAFFDAWGDDSPKEEQADLSKVAEIFTCMVDGAIDDGLKVLAMEPPVLRPFADSAGYALLHSALEQLPASATEAFERYWSVKTSESERVLARQNLLSNLIADAHWNQQKSNSVFDTFDALRTTIPEVSLADFSLPRPTDVEGEFDQPWNDAISLWRDRSWENVVEDVLKEPDARVLVFAGEGHFGNNMPAWPAERKTEKRFNELLQVKGHSATVIGFAGGDFPRAMVLDSQKQFGFPAPQSLILTDAAKACGLSDQKFAIRIDAITPRESDWVVHLPREPELN